MKTTSTVKATLLAAGLLVMTPMSVAAYGGPGSVISAIGAFIAVLAAIVAAGLGLVWFPMKKLIKWVRRGKKTPDEALGRSKEAGP